MLVEKALLKVPGVDDASAYPALRAAIATYNDVPISEAEQFEKFAKATGYITIAERAPTKEEAKELAAYARKHGLANLCRLILNSNEFMFVN